MNILGISAYYHDAAACLVQDGRIVAAAQEERFTRRKHDSDCPVNAAAYCLKAGNVGKDDLDAVAFYEKPLTKFSRLLSTYFRVAPQGFSSFLQAMPLWARQKLWIPYDIERAIRRLGYRRPKHFHFVEHHESHAASAYYPSPFSSAAVLTMDGVGEWATSTIGHGRGSNLSLLQQLRFPHSLGLLYSAFTYFCGFKVNSGEYKLMGLAPYGEPRFVRQIYDHLVDIRADGSLRMNPEYFNYLGGLTMTSRRFDELFGGPPRLSESRITRREMDLARSIQEVAEDVVLKMAAHAALLTGERENLCLAGGVALNCVANGRLLREGSYRRIWIQPAAGDAGGALGAAMYTWHQIANNGRTPDPADQMLGSYLGPSFSNEEIRAFLEANAYSYETIPTDEALAQRVAGLLADEKVVGLCTGRMEFGPRALGHRSIIGDPRSPKMQSVMNLKIKFRESFRPFAPSVLEEDASSFFELTHESPYMLLVAPVIEARRLATPATPRSDDLSLWVNEVRSDVPAITHVDYSARVQTVTKERNGVYYDILKEFKKLTGIGMVINTSFNVRGEPLVCTPEHAYNCFMRTNMDYLVLENQILDRTKQPHRDDDARWQTEFTLD